MTEEEARAKWCPFSRAIVIFDGGKAMAASNRNTESDTRCIASDCMAWRHWETLSGSSGRCGLVNESS